VLSNVVFLGALKYCCCENNRANDHEKGLVRVLKFTFFTILMTDKQSQPGTGQLAVSQFEKKEI
jgi:hypothetical protein